MRIRRACSLLAFATPLALVLALACSRKPSQPPPSSSPSASATLSPSVTASAAATAGATPSATPADAATGSTIKVGNWSVVVDRFRAQVSAPEGVNIRSSPEVKPDNRTGSLAPGAVVEVEGRVPQGQEAEPGNGTLWYFVGSVGTTPQFIYGPTGTLTAAGATATAAPASPTASPRPTP